MLTELRTWMLPAGVAALGLFAGLFIQRALLPLVARAASRSSFKYDDVAVQAIRGPIVMWCVLIGFRIALRVLPISRDIEGALATGLLILGVGSVTWAIARFAVGAMKTHATAGALPGVSLIANVTRILIFAIGLLVILQTLGISITPVITALGVGGLAVGLALQDTLANFFAGIRILASGKMHPGDFIKLDSGEEGYIQDITWAQTTIRQAANSLVIVPNAKLSSALTINYNLPDPEQGVIVPVGVSYGADLEQVERVTVEVARETLAQCPAGVASFEPLVRFVQFGDSSINFNVILRAIHHTERFPLVHDFIKRLHARYRAEGIEIPFPQRDITLRGGWGAGPGFGAARE